MPIPVTKYLCSRCSNQYDTSAEASACEAAGVPPNPYPAGSTLTFNNEESLLGSRYSYSNQSGVVLGAHLVFNRATGFHEWAWYVGCPHYEAVVFINPDEGPCCRAEDKYQLGYFMNHVVPRFRAHGIDICK